MKIHAYGCSFTSYLWPTYADILNLQFDVSNRGWSGAGNERIFYFFMHDVRHTQIHPNDIVIIQWSGVTRWDYLNRENKWLGDGNIFLEHNKMYYDKISDWYNPDYELDKTINYILSAQALLKDINCRYVFLSLEPIIDVNFFLETDLKNIYKGNYEFTKNIGHITKDKKIVDNHPTILQHHNLSLKIVDYFELDFLDYSNKIKKLDQTIIEKSVFDIDYNFNI